MTSRRGAILIDSDSQAEALIEDASSGIRANCRRINDICRAYVLRPDSKGGPLKPTAVTVAEELGDWPVQTIYNSQSYKALINIWKIAYEQLKDVSQGSTLSFVEQLGHADLMSMDIGARHTFQLAVRIINEQQRTIRKQQQIIEEQVPLRTEEVDDDLLRNLSEWADELLHFGFAIDDTAVRVSGKTPPNTPIIPRRLFDALSGYAVSRLR